MLMLLLYHIDRKASIGFSREALRAGAQPNRMPTEAENTNASVIAPALSWKVISSAIAIIHETRLPTSMPMNPPMSDSMTDSIRNCI